MAFGKLGYFQNRGSFREVREQDGFAVAISHLYLNRGNSDVLKFIFQPESQDAMIERLVAEKYEARLANEGGAGPSHRPWQEIVESDFRTPVSIARSSGLPRPYSAYLDGILDAFTTTDASPRNGQEDEDLATGELEGSIIRSPNSPRTPTSPLTGPSELSSEGSRRQSPIPAIRGAIRKVVRKKVVETKEEERERLNSLYTEEERVTFKRGGNEGQGDDLHKFETSDKEIANGEAEIPEEKEEAEDDEDDISPEDRLVAR
jgi:hypothetical protein